MLDRSSADISGRLTTTMHKLKDKVLRLFKRRYKPNSTQSEPEPTSPLHQQDTALVTSSAREAVDLASPIEDAGKALSSLMVPGRHVLGAIGAIEPTEEDVKSAYELWEPILEKVQILASVVEGIGDVRQPLSIELESPMLKAI